MSTTDPEKFTFHLFAGTHATVTLTPGKHLSEHDRCDLIRTIRCRVLSASGSAIVLPGRLPIDKIEFQHGEQGRED